MSDVTYYTEDGLKKLKEELQDMESVQRPKITQAIAEARDKGDLSENAEYDAAKEAQGMLEMKISKLKTILATARVIDESKLDNSKAFILSTVTIKNVSNSREMTYTLVADREADLSQKKISIDSPMGKGLLGKAIGELAEVETPNGVIQFEIVKIER